jgi:tetratricopeptide (TPR) repeat protein
MHRSKLYLTGLLLVSIFLTQLIAPKPAAAQDLVASEEIPGGSSVFVFRESRKKPQKHGASGIRLKTGRAPHAMNASVASAAQKRRAVAISRRTRAVSSADRRTALSNTLTVKAEGFLDKNQTDLAITNYRAALAQNGKNTRAAEGLSNALTAKGIDVAGDTNNANAIPLFEEAVKLDAQNDAALAKLGAIYDQNGQNEKAVGYYERAVALNPEYTQLYPVLGIAYVEQGEIGKADAALKRSEAAGLNDPDVEFLRGLVAFKNGRDDEALAAFDKAGASEARFAEAQYYRGQIYDRQGKPSEAVAQYRGALRSDPTFAPAAFDLGVASYNAGDYQAAAAAYQEAIKLDESNAQAHANLASTYRQLERFPEANAEYKTASTGIKNADLYSEWGYCLGKTTEWDKAVARLNTAAEMSPVAIDNSNVGWAYYNAGQFQTTAKNDAAAKSDFELARNFSQRAVTQDPKFDAAYLNLGSSHNALGEFQLAVNALNAAIGLHGNWVVAMNQLGYGYRGLGDLVNAISIFKQAVQLDSRNRFGLFNLGEAYYASGNKKDAKKINDQLRKVDPALSVRLDNVISGRAVVDDATRKVQQKIPKLPRFPY